MTKEFSVQAALPVINENCPACFEQPKERARVKQLLLQEEIMNPSLFYNLRKSLLPLMDESVYPVMSAIHERIAANGNRKEKCMLSSKNKHGLVAEIEVEAGVGVDSGGGSEEVAVDVDEEGVDSVPTKKIKL